MEIWQAIIVGVVQGLAEFLPVSSSGHIVLTEFLLGLREKGQPHHVDLAFEVMLHMGTLVSVLIFFRHRLWRLTKSLWTPAMQEDRMMIFWLGVATVPAVVAYLLLGDYFKAAYNNPVLVSGLLLVTGLILFIPRLVNGRSTEVGAKSSLIMGIGQAFAILPGVSRSGSTIACGLMSGLKAEKAAEFSFLMSIPAIAGGFVMSLKDRTESMGSFKVALESCFIETYMAGALASAFVGLLAIFLVMGVVRRGKLEYFSYYCFAAGITGMVYFSVWGW